MSSSRAPTGKRDQNGVVVRAHCEDCDWEFDRSLEAGDGSVAIYFRLPADHEWWLAYDAEAANGERYCQWTAYPSGAWDLCQVSAGILECSIGEIEGQTHDIYRSRVVCLEDAPEFVQREVSVDG